MTHFASQATDAVRTSGHLGAGLLFLLTLTAAVTTSTSYVLQPELTTAAADLHTSTATTTTAAAAAIVDYLVGWHSWCRWPTGRRGVPITRQPGPMLRLAGHEATSRP